MFYGIDDILQDIPHIQFELWNILQNTISPT